MYPITPNIVIPMHKPASVIMRKLWLRKRSSGIIGSWALRSTAMSSIKETTKPIMRPMITGDPHGYWFPPQVVNRINVEAVDAMNSIKGACFTAAVMQDCQDKPVDILMYYDARVGTIFNTLFNFYDFSPTSCYYPFYAWSKLVKYGQQVKVSGNSDPELHVTAAKDSKGRLGILVTRYTDDNNVVTAKKVKVNVMGMKINEAIGHRTDKHHLFTEVPVKVNGGTIEFNLDPTSFIYLSVE